MGGRVSTVVVGAGQAGLATSFHLARLGREHVVLERGRVGETWRSQRWDGFALNTPNWAQQLPGFPYAGPDPDAFAPLSEVITYLEEYARSFAAPVRENVEVLRVRRHGGGFRVETDAGAIDAEHVVVCAGAYQHPTPSPLAAKLPEDVAQLHTSAYRRPGQLPEGAVLIVGGGQSGCQIADELLAAGRRVYLSVGRCPWLPRRYRGRDLVHWLLETGMADDTVDSLPSPAARLACNPPVSGNDGGHDCHPRWLAARGATLVGRLAAVDGHRVAFGAGLEESLAAGDEFAAGFRRRVDEHVLAAGLAVPDPEPEDERPPIAPVGELDVRDEGVTTVMWANGFRPDHTWIDDVEPDAQGWPMHEMRLKVEAEIEDRFLEGLLLAKEERDQKPAESAVAVEKGMDGLELDVCQGCADQSWVDLPIVKKELEASETLHDPVGWRRYESCGARSRASDPVLTPANLAGLLAAPAALGQKFSVYFLDEAQREGEAIREPAQAMVHRGDVVGHLLHVVERNERDLFVLKQEQVR